MHDTPWPPPNSGKALELGLGEVATLYPAFLKLDSGGHITAAGPSLSCHVKVPLIGQKFTDLFTIERVVSPEEAEDPDYVQRLIVSFRGDVPIRLKGVALERVDGTWLLLGHLPIVDEQDQSLRLDQSDFAPTDSTLDMVMAVHHRSSLLENARNLAAELEEQVKFAETANAAKSAFLATMSHEIRTPMNGVLGLAAMLAETSLNNEQREMIDVMITSGKALVEILNDVLDLSKIEAGQVDLEKTVFNLPELARTTRALFAPTAAAKGLRFEMLTRTRSPYCLGNPARIRQIIVNLISNAIKFTDFGYVTVEIGVNERDGAQHLDIHVADSGIGMSPDAVERLFQPFVQVDMTTARQLGGTGLGLAITKRLCQQMQGSIRVDSALGRGTRFHVDLPTRFVDAPGKGLPKRAPNTAEPAGAFHVLIVEDNITNQFVLNLFLRKLGMSFEIVEHGVECLAAWERRHYDAILMDIEMPMLNGFDAAQEIRRREKARGLDPTPIIALSADAMMDNWERARLAGMNDFITKPVEIDTLRAVIVKAVQAASARESRRARTALHQNCQ